MKILIHDYAGHPFQVELSRELARRGHSVLHVYSASNLTPQGALQKRDDDPAGFDSAGIRLTEQVNKSSLVKRRSQEIEHGRLVSEQIDRFEPDALISANSPLDAQALLHKRCRARGIRFIYWVQDLLGVATYNMMSRRLPVIGHGIGAYYRRLEKTLLAGSDQVVLISQDFTTHIPESLIRDERVHVIENWAPLDEMPMQSRNNSWAERHGLTDKTCFLYSGTLGMKHNPDLLLQLALHFREQPDVRVVVISEGPGGKWLRAQKEQLSVDNLLLLPFQPFEEMPQVLGSADVLLAILDSGAGVFSVPSKVLTYLCAARPLLLAVPPENLAARIVARNSMGLLASPTDVGAFIDAADRLLTNTSERNAYGKHARNYAETHFDISRITDRFETVLGATSAPVRTVC